MRAAQVWETGLPSDPETGRPVTFRTAASSSPGMQLKRGEVVLINAREFKMDGRVMAFSITVTGYIMRLRDTTGLGRKG